MKFLSLFFILIYSHVNAQMSIDMVKKEIRETTQRINKEKNYKKVILLQSSFTDYQYDGGASVTGYFKAGKLLKVVRWIGLSSGYNIDEFYLREDSVLIFVNKTECIFGYNDSTNEYQYDKITKQYVGKYWFWNGGLIDKSVTGQSRFAVKEVNAEKDFLLDIENYSILLNKKFMQSKVR
jgi:hypothetical protein